MTTPDPLAGELAAIKDRQENGSAREFVTRDSPRLAAAVEAALAMHARSGKPVKSYALCPEHAENWDHAGRMFHLAVRACPDCTLTERYVCAQCRSDCPDDDEWPCPTYRAVAAALLGEGKPDGR